MGCRRPAWYPGFTSTKSSDLKFRAVPIESDARVLFYREGFDRFGELSIEGQRSHLTAPSRPTPATNSYATPYTRLPRPLEECGPVRLSWSTNGL
jgi:hypothetical protein